MKIFYYLFWDLYRFFMVLFTKKKLKVPNEVTEERLEICKNCPLINNEGRLFSKPQPRCSICGCYLSLKVRLSFESCPHDPPKWKEYE